MTIARTEPTFTWETIFISENGHVQACSTTSPKTQVERCKESVWTARKKWPLMQQASDMVIGVSSIQNRSRFGNTSSQGLFLILLTESGTNSLL